MPFDFNATSLGVWRQHICCLATAILFLSLPVVPVSAQSEDCSFLASPEELNTLTDTDKITIGQLRNRPYVVLLTHNLQDNLPIIRTCIPDAFLTSSRLGSYIHVASFYRYREARDLAEYISSSLDVNVRVIHLNRLRP